MCHVLGIVLDLYLGSRRELKFYYFDQEEVVLP